MPAGGVRDRETPFTIGVASFNLRIISDRLRSEIERRLRDLPLDYRWEILRSPDGEESLRVAWCLSGEIDPTYTKSDFTVVKP
jgi:hypothetical protein